MVVVVDEVVVDVVVAATTEEMNGEAARAERHNIATKHSFTQNGHAPRALVSALADERLMDRSTLLIRSCHHTWRQG